ncbi:isoprenoid synthase domain-containing protein [Suillus subalutaceus]|uniref:isoprenoid synthase domain-containing protein n=1 Tax=Suillus subalutaceus TaxID=48586 RepID=UPI001B87C18A|nr:isoprenoid synthase domain-containing protein [Suillus subalutaceus]KAG1837848.1 isoprenoid synthase domain-containing protein [Suillus subalutaceus]
MCRCYEFLDMKSRRFAAVIKKLDGELAGTRTAPDEKGRNLLLEYHTIVEEVDRLPPQYKTVILDICQKMENGRVDYAHKVATNGTVYLETIADYDLYCHYVPGLVGEEASFLCDQLQLATLWAFSFKRPKLSVIYVEERRFFRPREIWAKYGFNEMNDMYEKGYVEHATRTQIGMVLDALQSMSVLYTAPFSMAMATLALCFMNPEMFQRNIKMRKADAAHLIMRSTNAREVTLIFREYARKVTTRPNGMTQTSKFQ